MFSSNFSTSSFLWVTREPSCSGTSFSPEFYELFGASEGAEVGSVLLSDLIFKSFFLISTLISFLWAYYFNLIGTLAAGAFLTSLLWFLSILDFFFCCISCISFFYFSISIFFAAMPGDFSWFFANLILCASFFGFWPISFFTSCLVAGFSF
jgi:hypothetical protein